MGTVAEKLSYLADTKDLFRDRLNSLGAEITSSTTFRNYLNWLDTFYGEVSDKTDLSQNGVVGRTSQESTRGINVYNVNSHYVLSDGYSINNEDWITNTYDNSQGIEHYENIWCRATSLLETSTNYLIVCEIKSVSGSGILYPYTKHSSSAIDTQHSSYSFSSLSPGQKILIPVTTKSSFSGLSCDLRTFVRYYAGNSGSITFRLSLLTDTSITSDTFVYEPFTNGASPNPDYPQPINNLSGNVAYKVSGKNLLNKTNGTYESWVSIDITDLIEDGVNYYVSIDYKNLIGSCVIRIDYTYNGTINYIWGDGGSTGDVTEGTMHKQFNIPNHDVNTTIYLRVKDNGTGLTSGYYSNWLLAKSDTVTDYEPYIEPQTFNIPLKSKNLFDKNNITNGKYIKADGTTGTDATAFFSNYIKIEPNTNYYISGRTIWNSIGLYDSNKTFLERINLNYTSGIINITNNNCAYIMVNASIDNLNTMQLEEGNQSTAYEPYYDIELCKIDTYEDKIYSSNGRFYLRKETGKELIDENTVLPYLIVNTSTGNPNMAYAYTTYMDNKTPGGKGFCDKLINVPRVHIGTNSPREVFALASDWAHLRFYMKKSRLNAITAQGFKDWLANNNLLIYYPLSTPTTTEITQENYPALYNALKQIQDYLTAYKINKEFILGYSSPEIEY